MIYVLYHSDKDGQGAAYAAWKKFGETATYISVNYNQPIPEMENASYVYIVDFSYKKETLRELANRMRRVVVIDHHKSAKDELHPVWQDITNLEVVFDVTKAGCTLTWEYFFPSQPIPALLMHIADRDLWKFELAGTKEIHETLCSYSFSFELWSKFVSTSPDLLMKEGEAILRANNKAIKNICRDPIIMTVGGYTVLAVNTSFKHSECCSYLLDLIDEKEMYRDCKFAVAYSDQFKGEQICRKYDLRSRGDIDVSEVAKKLGGGGHKTASGFYQYLHPQDIR